jgi:probable rRNA maturation factor
MNSKSGKRPRIARPPIIPANEPRPHSRLSALVAKIAAACSLMLINRQTRVRVTMGPLRQFLRRVQKTLALPRGSLSVCLVSESEIARLNREFRGKIGPTDVLSFPAGDNARQARKARRRKRGAMPRRAAAPPRSPQAAATYLGDIAIAPAVALRNAQRDGRRVSVELRILILHGVLHLLGYDHETDNGTMERRERALRKRLGLA